MTSSAESSTAETPTPMTSTPRVADELAGTPGAADELAGRIRDRLRPIPDTPAPGVTFQDITPVLSDADLFGDVVAAARSRWGGQVDYVAGLEARGFIYGAPVAVALGAGFIPLRKAGKLPWRTVGVDYDLEYGTDRIEMHTDAAPAGARVLLVDDVLATGGTAVAAAGLLRRQGAALVGAEILVEITGLPGRSRLRQVEPDLEVTVRATV